MNKKRHQFIQDTRDFNNGWKDMYAERFFGKPYGRLTEQERLDVDDIVRGNEE